MSGGSMDYAYSKINEAAERIQHELAQLEFRKKRGVKAEKPSSYYVERHPDEAFLQSGEALRDAVIARLANALVVVRQAAIYAQRVEWLTSDDDSYEAFCLRLDEELAACKAQGGAE